MPLKQQLLDDMKAAMKSGNKQDLDAIRFVIAKVKNIEIDNGEQNDTQIQQLISKQIKEMQETMADYQRAGRQDLVDKDTANIAILKRYLPEPLSEAEVDILIDQVIAENPGAHMGMIIGKVNKEADGRADGGMVAQKVKAKLG
jgi:uncharacterized protein YqeY